MHTEAFFESDHAFKIFTQTHIGELEKISPSGRGKTSVAIIRDTRDDHLFMAYGLRERADDLTIVDTCPVPWEPPFNRPFFAHVGKRVKPQGMRHYKTLESPLFRAPLVVIDALQTLFAGQVEDCAEGRLVSCRLCGCALTLQQRRPNDDVRLVIHDNAQVRLRRMQGTLGENEPLEVEFYFMRALNTCGDEEAPEAYSFDGIVEDVTRSEFCGVGYFQLLLSCPTVDDTLPIYYTVYAGEAVLNGYRPRIGDSVTGVLALSVSMSEPENEPGMQDELELYNLCEEAALRPPEHPNAQGASPIVREETFPWGTVGYDANGEAIRCVPAPDCPVRSEMKGMALYLPQKPKLGAPCSRLRARSLPRFSFPDEFASLLPEDLELCENDRELAMAALRRIRLPRAPWKNPHRADDFALLQTARSVTENQVFCWLAYTEPLSRCEKYLLLLLDASNGHPLRYTVLFRPIASSMALHRIVYESGNGTFVSHALTLDEALWTRIRNDGDGKFVIVNNQRTGEFFQFTLPFSEVEEVEVEFQVASLDLQFAARATSCEQVREALDLWLKRDLRLYTCLPWTHCVIRER